MSLLENIRPAPAKLVIDNGNTPLHELLKVTFMDLVLKKVLVFVEVHRQPDEKAKIQHYIYVQPGAAFSTYRPQRHEQVILRPFQYDASIRILFRSLLKIIFEEAGSLVAHNRRIVSDMVVFNAWTSGPLTSILGNRLTSAGDQLRSDLIAEVEALGTEVRPLVEAGDHAIAPHLATYGGHLLLIEGLDLSALPYFSGNAFKKFKKTEHDIASSAGCGVGCGGVHPRSFEDGFFIEAGASGSGCGGDASGCGGGCSGCGGCGGCGG